MHVVDPHTFPLAKTAQYTPSPHTVQNAKAFLTDRLNISKMVIVQPSIYGNDNACTLDGLAQLGPSNGRAVIQFDPGATSPAQLQSWHDLGVRGVRLNFKSVGAAVSGVSLATSLHAYADAVAQFQGTWVLELYIGMEDLPLLEPLVPDLGPGVKLCIDHFAHPSAASLQKAQSVDELPGFSSLVNLLTKRDDVWVKCSAGYRLDPDPRNPIVRSLMREVFRARPDRCVFATDWPHTRFEGVDLAGHLEALLECAEAEGCDLEGFCVTNAEELFDAKTK